MFIQFGMDMNLLCASNTGMLNKCLLFKWTALYSIQDYLEESKWIPVKNSLLFQGTHQSTKLSVLQRNPILCTWIKAADVNSFCLDYMDSNLKGLYRVKC